MCKKITLINPPGYKPIQGIGLNSPNPPIGLAYLAGSLEKNGIDYDLIDMTGEAFNQVTKLKGKENIWVLGLTNLQVIDRISMDTDIIGISCMFSMHWPLVRKLSKEIRKKKPNIQIIAGGEHISALPEFSLKESSLNCAIVGEGEEVIVELIDALRAKKSLDNIKGICFKDSSRNIIKTEKRKRIKGIDSISWPSWEKIPIENYINSNMQNGVNRGRSMPIVATRGCPFKCSFCSNINMWGVNHYVRSPRDVVEEMKFYINKYQVSNFNFQDLTAFVRKKWVIELCDEINNNKLGITWQLPSGTRIESFDEQVARAVRKSGCRNIAFAPESASNKVLQSVQKDIDLDKLLEACRVSVKSNLNLSCFFIVGLPLETHDTLKQTLKFIRKLAWIGISDIGMSKFVPYPGSPLFEQFRSENIVELNDDFFLSSLDFYTFANNSYAKEVSAKSLYRWQIYMLLNFYFLSAIFHPIRTTKNILKAIFFKNEETRYAKFITDIIYYRPQVFLNSLKKK